MKIKHLFEEENESLDSLYDQIINSEFFEINLKDWFESLDLSDIESSWEIVKNDIPMLYHGGKLKSGEVNNIVYRQKPMDTPNVIHNTINDISNDKLGAQIRSMVFATLSPSQASEYGEVFRVFPLSSDYELYYSTLVDDMYVSSKIFNSVKYRNNISSMLKDFSKTDKVKSLLNKIDALFGGYIKPDIGRYINKHISNYVDTIFIRFISNAKLTELNDFDFVINEAVIKAAYREMFNVLTMMYSLEKISELEGEYYDQFEKLLYELTILTLEAFRDYKEQWIVSESKKYVDSIEKTEDLKDIIAQNDRTEIMLPKGPYAVLQNNGVGGDLYGLLEYYIKNKNNS